VAGDMKGMKPSITSTSATASQKVVLSKPAPGVISWDWPTRPRA
jgi:hypothetical protein